MLGKIHVLCTWLFNKAPELSELSAHDALLAKVVVAIKATASSRVYALVPLANIESIHPINRETARQKVSERAARLQRHRDTVLNEGATLSRELLAEILPSVSDIQAIPYREGYIAFEGNGRIAALHEVFSHDAVVCEVEVFTIPRDSSIYSDIAELHQRYAMSER